MERRDFLKKAAGVTGLVTVFPVQVLGKDGWKSITSEYGNYIWHEEPMPPEAYKALLEANAKDSLKQLNRQYGPIQYDWNIQRHYFDESGKPVNGYSSGWRVTVYG